MAKAANKAEIVNQNGHSHRSIKPVKNITIETTRATLAKFIFTLPLTRDSLAGFAFHIRHCDIKLIAETMPAIPQSAMIVNKTMTGVFCEIA